MSQLGAELHDLYMQLFQSAFAPGGVSPDLLRGRVALSSLSCCCCRGRRWCSGIFCFTAAKCKYRNSGASGKYRINSVCLYLGITVDAQNEGLP